MVSDVELVIRYKLILEINVMVEFVDEVGMPIFNRFEISVVFNNSRSFLFCGPVAKLFFELSEFPWYSCIAYTQLFPKLKPVGH